MLILFNFIINLFYLHSLWFPRNKKAICTHDSPSGDSRCSCFCSSVEGQQGETAHL